VLEISKLRKGGFTILFKEKEIVDWLNNAGVESNFTSALAEDATITKCNFPILIPCIPLTFDPTEDSHLREVEECNELPTGTIVKARWIKLVYRRAPEQRSAHAIFALKDVATANICIRDGLYVCSLHIRPSQLKHKPMQCMKCRKWGHFANACMATDDTCGTCGGKHRTNKCTVKDKTYCISCKSVNHASWDREFQCRCMQFDENYPENNLPYFPTEGEWTLIPCPNRLQLAEKFPARYAVSAFPQSCQNERLPDPRTAQKQRKHKLAKLPANQYTMDRYLGPDNAHRSENTNDSNTDYYAAPGRLDTTAPFYDCKNSRDRNPRHWN
jgi:hypothetical protein